MKGFFKNFLRIQLWFFKGIDFITFLKEYFQWIWSNIKNYYHGIITYIGLYISAPISSCVHPFLPEKMRSYHDVSVAGADLGVQHVGDEGLGAHVPVQQSRHHPLDNISTTQGLVRNSCVFSSFSHWVANPTSSKGKFLVFFCRIENIIARLFCYETYFLRPLFSGN